MLRKFAVCIALLFMIPLGLSVTGCAAATQTQGMPLAQITFQHLSPIPLQVNSIELAFNEKAYSLQDDFYPNLPVLLNNYFLRRLSSVDDYKSSEVFEVNVEMINIDKVTKTASDSFINIADIAKIDEYNLLIKINLALTNEDNSAMKSRSFTVKRALQIPEHFSISKREAAQMVSIEKMFQDIDRGVIEILQENFSEIQ